MLLETLIKKAERRGIKEEEIEKKVKEKKERFRGILNNEAAAELVAEELGLDIEIEKIGEMGTNTAGNVEITVEKIFPEKALPNSPAKMMCVMLVRDSSGEYRFVLWGNQANIARYIEKGDKLLVENIRKVKNGDDFEIHSTSKLKISLEKRSEEKTKKIEELREGEIVDIRGTAENIIPMREFEKNGRKGKIASFELVEKNKRIRVVLWNDSAEMSKYIKEKQPIKIEEGIVRNGEIHITKGRVAIRPKSTGK